MNGAGEDVYCTLVMSDSYLPGAAVLARSLRDCGTKKKLAVLVTLDSLLATTISELQELYDYVIPVDRLTNPNLENLHRLDRLDLRFAFTKIALWRQERFSKIVYIDADVVALRAPDELFEIDSHFAAAPDVGWPDIFNSGVMVLKPSMSEYWSLHTLASSGTSFDGADQGLLNEYFGNRPWHRLSFTYNCTPSSGYQYEPAYRHFRSSINMVHFIGKDKPWMMGRKALNSGHSGVYKELLGKWWSVYDRHYRTFVGLTRRWLYHLADPPKTSSALGGISPGRRAVQQQVHGEQTPGWTTIPQSVPPTASDAPAGSAEEPLTDPMEPAESIDQGFTEPQPTVEQRRFSAPHMEWDATKAEPPLVSKPEAYDFPVQKYEMSRDHGLFKPPQAYPEAPKDMYYKVPDTKPATSERPKPIFPWEHHAHKPTRVFADDGPQSPQAEFPAAVSSAPKGPIPSIVEPSNPWESFTRTNAWDDNASIEKYVRALTSSQQRKAPVQIVHQQSATVDEKVDSPLTSPAIAERRESKSLILTDFPTAVERPSLPVTPAPIHRHTFWGGERNQEGNLPAARGVPEQADWNPAERLEELRRASIIATEDLPKTLPKEVPQRAAPASASSVGNERAAESPLTKPEPPERQDVLGSAGVSGNTAEKAVERPDTSAILDEYSIA